MVVMMMMTITTSLNVKASKNLFQRRMFSAHSCEMSLFACEYILLSDHYQSRHHHYNMQYIYTPVYSCPCYTIEIRIFMTMINTLVRKSSSVWTVSISTRRFILCRQSIGLEGELYGDDVESWLNVEIKTILLLATTIMRATTMKVTTTVIMMVNTKQW